jgi:hypothetical protein
VCARLARVVKLYFILLTNIHNCPAYSRKKLKGIGSEGRRTCSSLLPHIQMSNKKLKDGDDSAYRKVGLLLEIKMDK